MENLPKIQIILGSTRQGRRGEKVAKWVLGQAIMRKDLKVELLDLRDWPLPFFDEPKSPSTISEGEYSTKAANQWAAKVAEADGYVIVTPEYNHGYSAVLKNALDYVYKGWNNKPVFFVSYSTGSVGGARAVEQLRVVVNNLQMVALQAALHLPRVHEAFDEQGGVKDARFNSGLSAIFDQLAKLANIYKSNQGRGNE